jgi:hypothetical protein
VDLPAHIRKRRVLVVGLLYLVAVAVLSSVDLFYRWYSPLTVEDGSVSWYRGVGLAGGAIGMWNRELFAPGFGFRIHVPRVFLSPLFGSAGAEGGVAFVALWFVGLIAWLLHSAVLSGRESARSGRSGPSGGQG